MLIPGAYNPETTKDIYTATPKSQADAMMRRANKLKKTKKQLDEEDYNESFRHQMLTKGKYAGRTGI